MAHTPYLGSDLERAEIREVRANAGHLYNSALNECLTSHPERVVRRHMELWGVELNFSLEKFWFCLSGLKKTIYHGVYGCGAEEYLELFDRWRTMVEERVGEAGYRATVFIVYDGDLKQMAVLFSPEEAPRCPPEALAEEINALGQDIYEEVFFKGDDRYCNVTALSDELHGYEGIREGYLQARKLNDLSFFCMEPCVLTAERVAALRNEADYHTVMEECDKLRQALDSGDTAACRTQLDSLLCRTVKGALRWDLLQDTLSYCKHMLDLRCTVRGVKGVDLERLCDRESYLTIEECREALWPVLEELCERTREQGPCQEIMLRAVYYIKLHYDRDISRTDVARYANVNQNYLSSLFREEMGLSVREFITEERLRAAQDLLAESDLPVGEIAERVGFHDVKYFGRLFKKEVGMTPGEYRRGRQGADAGPGER